MLTEHYKIHRKREKCMVLVSQYSTGTKQDIASFSQYVTKMLSSTLRMKDLGNYFFLPWIKSSWEYLMDEKYQEGKPLILLFICSVQWPPKLERCFKKEKFPKSLIEFRHNRFLLQYSIRDLKVSSFCLPTSMQLLIDYIEYMQHIQYICRHCLTVQF